jgi:hypothetical protein
VVALAAQIRRRPPVDHALVEQELGDIPCRAGGDLGLQPGCGGGLAKGGAAAGKRPQVIVQAQQGRHGGMVKATADRRWHAVHRAGGPFDADLVEVWRSFLRTYGGDWRRRPPVARSASSRIGA